MYKYAYGSPKITEENGHTLPYSFQTEKVQEWHKERSYLCLLKFLTIGDHENGFSCPASKSTFKKIVKVQQYGMMTKGTRHQALVTGSQHPGHI